MKKFFYAMMCIVSLCLSGCGYDDNKVWNAINDQEERIAALEEWQKTANENIAALQAIVNGNDYITSVEEIKDGDEVIGYTINFYRQGEVNMEKVEDLLQKLQEKFGDARSIIEQANVEDPCDHFFYDAGCESCKGNATGY